MYTMLHINTLKIIKVRPLANPFPANSASILHRMIGLDYDSKEAEKGGVGDQGSARNPVYWIKGPDQLRYWMRVAPNGRSPVQEIRPVG